MNPLTIGSFQYVRGTYRGRLQTLGIDAVLCLIPADPRDGEDAPGWRVHLGDSAEGPVVGEGRNSIEGPFGFHIAVLIDGPICPRQIASMLLSPRHSEVHHPVWNRLSVANEKG